MKGIKKFFKSFAKVAYKAEESLENHIHNIPQGWEVLAKSTDSVQASAHSFRAVAFINREENKVIIANAGTNPFNLSDLSDDLKVYKGETPDKLPAIFKFLSLVTSKIPADCTISTTGHSLGGVLAEIEAVILKGQGYNVGSSVTFDNPGAKPIIEKAMHDGLIDRVSFKELSEIDFETVNVRPNLVNTTNAQMGRMFMIVPPKTEGTSEAINYGEQSYVSYLFSKVGSAFTNAISTFNFSEAYTAITKLYDVNYIADIKEKLHAVYEEVTKLSEISSGRIEKIKTEVFNVLSNLTLISSGAVTIYTTGNILSGVPAIATGTVGLVSEFNSLHRDVSELIKDGLTIYNNISRLHEHKLDSFDAALDAEGDNLFEVTSGYSKKDSGHIVIKTPNKTLLSRIKDSIKYKADSKPVSEEKPGFMEKALTSIKKFFGIDEYGSKIVIAAEDVYGEEVHTSWSDLQKIAYTPDLYASEPDEIFSAACLHASLLGEENIPGAENTTIVAAAA